jgi:16S rRNA (cytosine967-C5)-methyltransferase
LKRSGRVVALGAVAAVLRDGRSLSGAFEAAAAGLDDPREGALARELAFGVFRWLPRLDAILRRLMKRPLRRKDADVRAILLIGLYQLLFTRIPARAAVAESVALSREIGKPWSDALVNAVLRRFQREGAGVLESVTRSEEASYAHPGWLIEAIRRAWPDAWQRILEAGNSRAPMTLRVNARASTRDAYLERLKAAAIWRWTHCRGSPTGWSRYRTPPPSSPRRCWSWSRAIECWMPAPRRAARRLTCWNPGPPQSR